MDPTITINQPLHWSEGMLLSPQHFQQNNLYLEQQLYHQLKRVAPFFHGFLGLTIDRETMQAKENRQIRVTQLHAIMRDGTEIAYPNQHASETVNSRPLEYEIKDLSAVPEDQPFYIYLAITERQYTSGVSKNVKSRYSFCAQDAVRDLFDDANAITLDTLSLSTRLLSKQELKPSHSALPLIKLIKRQDKIDVLPYTPPCLNVTPVTTDTPGQSDLWWRLENKLALLKQKFNERRTFLQKGNEEAQLALHERIELQLLNQHLPGLKIMINNHRTHPLDVYLKLVDLVSNLAIICCNGRHLDYKNYDHDDLEGIFDEPLKELNNVLKMLTLPFRREPFQHEKHRFSYLFGDHQPPKELKLAFRMQANVSREDLRKWIESACICSEDKQHLVAKNRLLGLKRTAVSGFSALNIKETNGELLYQVETDADYFNLQADNQMLANPLIIYGSDENLNKFAPAAIYILRGQG